MEESEVPEEDGGKEKRVESEEWEGGGFLPGRKCALRG